MLEKLRNPAEYARARPLPDLGGKNAVVVDDFLTTGDTLSGLRRLLKSQGVGDVRTIVLGGSDPYFVRDSDLRSFSKWLAEKTGRPHNEVERLVETHLRGEYRGQAPGQEKTAREVYAILNEREGAALRANA